MAKLTITEAAALTGKHRSTLYRAIEAGRLSCDPDGCLDTAELLRVGYTLQAVPEPPHATAQRDATQQLRDTAQHDATTRHDATRHGGMSIVDAENAVLRRECELLQQQLDATRDMLQQQLDATRDYREQIRYLSQMLHEAQQRYDRLLEAPRAAAPAEAARPTARPRGDRRALWYEILAYLREHPGPQRALDVEQALGPETPGRYAMGRMVQAGLLRRVQDGVSPSGFG
jgi:small-conductance mechanosensitive channel